MGPIRIKENIIILFTNFLRYMMNLWSKIDLLAIVDPLEILNCLDHYLGPN